MLRIGLTGGIGAGKSAACRIFAELGVPVLDADQISREVVAPGEPALARIAELFGDTVLTSEGFLNRSYLRDIIFTNPERRRQLEAILHPLIQQRLIEQSGKLKAPYVILAIPLLLEAGWKTLVDRILVIDSPVEEQINRTIKRDGINREQTEAIIASQLDRSERLRQAEDIIVNDGDLQHLRSQINALHHRYLSIASSENS